MKIILYFFILCSFALAEEETEFDKFVDQQKKENLSEKTRKELEARPDLTPKAGETRFDRFIDKTLKSEKPKRKKGLIDPLIDGAKEASEEGKKKIEKVTGKILASEDLREDSFGTFTLGYQPFATWIPSKWSASYTQIFSSRWSLEGEYSRSSLSIPIKGIDIGAIREERVNLQARYYPGNSFNWTFGLVYQRAQAHLGADIPATSKINVFEMENFGLSAGLGNRWQWKNGFTFGVDWFRMNQPLFSRWENDSVLKTVSSDDASDLKSIMRAFNTLPTFVLLGLQLGYTF